MSPPTGDPVAFGCRCPAAWFGVVPPPCPVHNPSLPSVVSAGVAPMPSWAAAAPMVSQLITYESCASCGWMHVRGAACVSPHRLSDADVERVARRVVELVREQLAGMDITLEPLARKT